MRKVVGSFEVPEDLAKRLSNLLTKKAIREQVLTSLVDDMAKFETVEATLIPLVNEIDSIKNKVTVEYVPEKFQSEKYQWSYNGFEIDGTRVEVYEET